MHIVFFGTHTFAATILKGLLDNPFFEVTLVITQPDRPVGRKQKLQASPVKLLAQKQNLQIQQPDSLKKFDFRLPTSRKGTLSPRDCRSEIQIVAQYGLLIPKNILKTPKHGTINVHTSLLPKYRGASPIQSALLNGDTKTGLTIMCMDEGMDSGPILLQKEIDILADETYLELDARMSHIGVELLNISIPKYIAGELQPQPQDELQVTFCKKLSREDGKVDWSKTSQQIYNQYRGLTPWPGIWTTWGDKRLKILSCKPSHKKIDVGRVHIENTRLLVGTRDASLELCSVQLEGKSQMDTSSFIQGYTSHLNGSVLV